MRKKGIITRVLMRRLLTCARLQGGAYDVHSIVKSFVAGLVPREIRKAVVGDMDAHFMDDDGDDIDDVIHIFLGHDEEQFHTVKL